MSAADRKSLKNEALKTFYTLDMKN